MTVPREDVRLWLARMLVRWVNHGERDNNARNWNPWVVVRRVWG